MNNSAEKIRDEIKQTDEAITRHLGLLNGSGAVATLGFAGAMLNRQIINGFIVVPFFLFAFGAFVLVLGRYSELYQLAKRLRGLDPKAELFLSDDRKFQFGKMSISLGDIFIMQERINVWSRTVSLFCFLFGILAGGVLLFLIF